MSSPCVQSNYCGKHKTHYLDDSDKKSNVPLKCSSKVCNMVPSTECNQEDENKDKKNCAFYIQKSNGDGLKGYYLSNIVYFEEAQNSASENQKKVFRSHALPIGCTSVEYGFYKEMKADGVMGLNNEDNSFISLLYNLKIIDKNLFSLCLGSERGYMSLGEIDTTYHFSKTINYIPLVNSSQFYTFYLNGILVGYNKDSLITKIKGYIDTTREYTVLPKDTYKLLIKEFEDFCSSKKGKNKCGKMAYEKDLGYCADFSNKDYLLKVVKEYWPNITIQFNNFNYVWKPINYYHYYSKGNIIKACIGFKSHRAEKAILGTNFMQGNDVIFDRENKSIGIVPADCARKSLISKAEANGKINPNIDIRERIHNAILGNNEGLTFIKGKNKELEFNSPRVLNFVILLISILIIVIVVLIVVIVLMYKNKEYSKLQTVSDESNKYTQNNVMEEINDTKITQEEVQFLKNMMKNTH